MNFTIKDSFLSAREDVLAARKCENINDPIDTYVIDYIAMGWSRIFIKLHIIPNVVTLLSMLSGVSGGILLALDLSLGWNIAGALLVILSAVFDASDGQVARLTKHYSQLGRMLDGLSDATVYFTLYLACVVRLWEPSLLANGTLWHILVVVLGLAAFLFFIIQSQLPDYFKNLHMYMIDNSHGNELSRSKHVLAKLAETKKGTFAHFSQLCYYLYTKPQERRAPQTQKLLDAIEIHGKNDAVCDGFYEKSSLLVRLTNLLTFNLRTIVLLTAIFLRVELIALLFPLLVLEPIRVILLRRYEKLSRDLLPLVD